MLSVLVCPLFNRRPSPPASPRQPLPPPNLSPSFHHRVFSNSIMSRKLAASVREREAYTHIYIKGAGVVAGARRRRARERWAEGRLLRFLDGRRPPLSFATVLRRRSPGEDITTVRPIPKCPRHRSPDKYGHRTRSRYISHTLLNCPIWFDLSSNPFSRRKGWTIFKQGWNVSSTEVATRIDYFCIRGARRKPASTTRHYTWLRVSKRRARPMGATMCKVEAPLLRKLRKPGVILRRILRR